MNFIRFGGSGYTLPDPESICRHCSSGLVSLSQPHDGLYFRACPHCTQACRYCGGRACFPEADCLDCYLEDLTEEARTAYLCPECHGVLEVR